MTSTATPHSVQHHDRRVLRMLDLGNGALLVLGLAWGLYFAHAGHRLVVAMDLTMMVVGALSLYWSRKHMLRAAAMLQIAGMYGLIVALALWADVPNANAPRTMHLYLFMTATFARLYFLNERPWLSVGVPLLCVVTFCALASTTWGVRSPYALPDELRVPGSWITSATVAVLVLFLLKVLQDDLLEHDSLVLDLRRGLREQEFELYYQPQLGREGHIVGAECLIRWNHPQRGLVLPGDFIALAEQSGVIHPMGQWVLATACRQLVLWSRDPALAHLTLSVNVSALQFLQRDFVPQTLSVLERSGVNPARLKLELTETILAYDMEAIVEKMSAIKAVGVRFALDDFGTGYSSLSYLQRLPLDQLKVDQSFVRNILTDPNDAAIARTVVALGRTLRLDVMAEGVESEAQRSFLAEMGCLGVQGYLIGRPTRLSAFEAQVHERDGARNATGSDKPAPAPGWVSSTFPAPAA